MDTNCLVQKTHEPERPRANPISHERRCGAMYATRIATCRSHGIHRSIDRSSVSVSLASP
jgi:hypothetical protein